MGIKHTDVKVSGEKGFAAEWNKNHVIDGDVDMLQNSWENQVIENVVAFPGGPVEGQIVWRSDLNKLYVWDGAAWSELVGGIYTAGEGIDIVARVISGEDATTVNKGIASFNTNDFSVAGGAVSLKNKTSYLSIPGNAFLPTNETQAFDRNITDGVFELDSSQNISVPIYLPHGAVVTACIVYGSDAVETWVLRRSAIASSVAGEVMATANINTEDVTIANATIDNSAKKYWLSTSPLDAADEIRGARITYTTDYI